MSRTHSSKVRGISPIPQARSTSILPSIPTTLRHMGTAEIFPSTVISCWMIGL